MDDAQLDFDRRLKAAEGYVELGMFLDANAELDGIAVESRDDSAVLALRAGIYRRLENWEAMQAVAKALVLRDPMAFQPWVWLAYAVRRALSIDTARHVLLQALNGLPNAAILHYNLACYECQLGRLEIAKAKLRHAFSLDAALEAKASDDEDLAPLWK